MDFKTTRQPDFEQFLRVLRRDRKPRHLPFYEHIASPGFIARRTGAPFDEMPPDHEDYWRIYVDFWLGMGFDCVPMEIPLNPDRRTSRVFRRWSRSRRCRRTSAASSCRA